MDNITNICVEQEESEDECTMEDIFGSECEDTDVSEDEELSKKNEAKEFNEEAKEEKKSNKSGRASKWERFRSKSLQRLYAKHIKAIASAPWH